MARQRGTTRSGKADNALDEMPLEQEAFVHVVLNHALEMEGNFLALYDVAIEASEDREVKERLTAFRSDHERHVERLRGAIEQLDGPILVEGAQPTPLARELAKMLQAATTDEELLTHFLATEDLSRRFYGWLATLAAPEPIAHLVQQGLQDEERHYAWAAKRVGALATRE